MMAPGRWAFLMLAIVLLIVSVTLALQGSTGLWFTAVAMGIAIFTTLRSRLKERRQNQSSSASKS
jgi:Flp pilus assembly protein TadB